jgi:adenylosuccinate lyase
MAAQLSNLTKRPLRTASNKLAAQGSLDAIVGVSAGLRGVAVSLMKLANDMRWLASGPRVGLDELRSPANEPGSSIMPGKVNPTQEGAMVWASVRRKRTAGVERWLQAIAVKVERSWAEDREQDGLSPAVLAAPRTGGLQVA